MAADSCWISARSSATVYGCVYQMTTLRCGGCRERDLARPDALDEGYSENQYSL